MPGDLKALATIRVVLGGAACLGCAGAIRGLAGAVGWVLAAVMSVAAAAAAGLLGAAGANREGGRRCDSARNVAMLSMLGWSNACEGRQQKEHTSSSRQAGQVWVCCLEAQ